MLNLFLCTFLNIFSKLVFQLNMKVRKKNGSITQGIKGLENTNVSSLSMTLPEGGPYCACLPVDKSLQLPRYGRRIRAIHSSEVHGLLSIRLQTRLEVGISKYRKHG